jgi:hypothetical protein
MEIKIKIKRWATRKETKRKLECKKRPVGVSRGRLACGSRNREQGGSETSIEFSAGKSAGQPEAGAVRDERWL